jgi:WD40 repeat protein
VAAQGWKEETVLTDHRREVLQVAISSDGKYLASCDADGVVCLHELAGGKRLWMRTTRGTGVALSFSEDSKRLLTASGQMPGGHVTAVVTAWDVSTGARRWRTLIRGAGTPYAISPDHRLLASCGSSPRHNKAHLWQLPGGRAVAGPRPHGDCVTFLAFSPASTLLASASSDKTVKLWHISKRAETTLRDFDEEVAALAFSPDGRALATGSVAHIAFVCGAFVPRDNLALWDVARGKQAARFLVDGLDPRALVYAPSGKALAVGGSHGLQVWDLELIPLRAPPLVGRPRSVIASLAFAPDGRGLAVADRKVVRVFRLAVSR